MEKGAYMNGISFVDWIATFALLCQVQAEGGRPEALQPPQGAQHPHYPTQEASLNVAA